MVGPDPSGLFYAVLSQDAQGRISALRIPHLCLPLYARLILALVVHHTHVP